MIKIYANPSEPILLGREGENLARQIIFDLTRWQKLYGPGVAQLIAQRVGETTPYPVALTLDGTSVIWSVTAADTAIHGMSGKAELRYYVGETLAKSETWRTIVLDALDEPSEEPPEAQKNWVDQVLQSGVDAENAAQRAEEAAQKAEEAAERAEEAAASGGNTGDGTGGFSYKIGHGLKVESNTLMVDSVSNFDNDNTLPATASLVQSTVGNIEVILATI